MDEIDMLQDQEESRMANLIANRPRPPVSPTGRCLWCDEPLEPPAQAYCDSDCERYDNLSKRRI